MTFAAVFLLTACTKQLDLDKTSGELRYCPIQKMVATFVSNDNPLNSVGYEIDFFYNKAGNPDSTVSGLQRGGGIMPDHTVIPSVADLVAGKDTVLQFAMQLASR